MEEIEEIDFSAEYRPQIQVEEPWLPKDLWSEILPGLWVGGCSDSDTIEGVLKGEIKPKPLSKEQFDTVVTLYSFANPCDWLVKELRYGYYDAPTMQGIDMATIDQIVDIAHADWRSGKRVGVRCQLGINRSGLIMALILIKEGYTADEAISLIRKKRSPYALFNKLFVEYLYAHELNKAS